MPGRLNIFQRAMLLWNDLHPYNAVHTVEVPAALNLERLSNILNKVLETHGLTGLTLDRNTKTYHYQGGPAAEQIAMVPAGTDTSKALVDEIQRQLNTPFIPGKNITPFRFFVIETHSSFYFGISYFHMVAGAESLVLLMQDLVNAFLDRDERGLSPPVNLYPTTYGNWLRRHPGTLLRKMVNIPFLYWSLNRSWRPRYRDEMDMDIGLSMFSLTAPQLEQLKSASKAWSVTLNDLFLALMLKIFAPLEDNRALSSKRNRLSIGTIVNIRKDMGVDSRRTFGLFLGSFVVSHAVPKGISLKKLAQDVNRQTSRIKRTRRYMGAPLDLASSLRTLSMLTTERKKKFYQKHYPLWGGLTNMNLNTIWPQSDETQPINYFRAVSSGPTTPLVLSITTVQDRVNISVSYRTTVFSKVDIEYVKSEFPGLLRHLEDHP